jgi:hypothetical protein
MWFIMLTVFVLLARLLEIVLVRVLVLVLLLVVAGRS